MAAKRRPSKAKKPAGSVAAPKKRGGAKLPIAKQRGGFPIVGIGASAGGLEAYRAFFAHVPADTGMAFVLVPHLDPNHPSALRSLLTSYTAMPVVEAMDGLAVKANHVYVLAPNSELRIRDGRLRVARPGRPRGQRTPIDLFFTSLAADQGENAISIILSGTGSDGTLGTAAIKEHGGLTMAQYGGTLKYDSMPRHAQETGLIDFAVPAEAMPQRLLEYTRHLNRIDETKGADGMRREVAAQRLKICLLLRNRTGHDFSNYKENTFIRRVIRRMQVLQLDSAVRFLKCLRRDPTQIDLLFQELLIGVTQFFRDPKSFEALETGVIPEILKDRSPANPVRIWVAGCASGEEAYSLAILFREQIARRELNVRFQVFATDIDSHALEVARIGWYPASIANDVKPQRLERYFTREGGGYKINKELREYCIFSAHNFVKDPPFSKLDLVSCRNVLIYLNADLQQRVLPLLHFALNPGGFLFLGPSENVSDQGKLFNRIDAKARIFRRRSAALARLPELALAPPLRRRPPPPEGAAPRPKRVEDDIGRRVEQIVESQRPAHVVVDESGEVLRFSGPTSRFLQHATGAASLNIYTLVDRALRSELRAIMHQAVAARRRVDHQVIPMPVEGGTQDVYVVIEPLGGDGPTPPLWLISFQSVGPVRKRIKGSAKQAAKHERTRLARMESLEAELTTTHERLQSAIEELETSNEELKSSNEEFQSLNEELQSANEELETSKEELQSVNEELETVNSELNSKVESLDRANSDLKNLLESTQIATVFLDNDLRIKSFTPPTTDIFNLIESDIGRPITDIAGRLSHDFAPDVRKVQRTLTRIEHEVKLADGTAYIMRILPYRTVGNVIDGVVITFIDISERRRAEEERALLAALVRSSQDAITVTDPSGKVLAWNHGAERMYGYSAKQMIGQQLTAIIPTEGAEEWKQQLKRAQRGEAPPTFELIRQRQDGGRVIASVNVAPVPDAADRVVAISSIERDITEAKRAQERQGLLLAELDHRVKNTLALVNAIVAHTLTNRTTPEEFTQAIQGRLRALGQAHRLLAQNQWHGTQLEAILSEQLVPFRTRRLRSVTLKGPKVSLNSAAALTLSMVIHELAANAAKYGALSTADGALDILWRVENTAAPPRLVLDWQESGGPETGPPERRGFGTELIERAIAYDLGGSARLDYPAGGARCRIEIPLVAKTGTSETSG
jgi:two-component system, chemotaxis family, CheB/CheR fusion protein